MSLDLRQHTDYMKISEALEALAKSNKDSLECKFWDLKLTIELKDGYYVVNFHHNDGFDRPHSSFWEQLAKEHGLENDYLSFYGTGDQKGVLIAEVQDNFIKIKADQAKPELAQDLYRLYMRGVDSSRSSCRFMFNAPHGKEVAIRDDTPKTKDYFQPSNWSPPKE